MRCHSFLIIATLLSEYLISGFEQILDTTMTLDWVISGDEIQFRLQCQILSGYCALGFAGSMSDCDMIAALSDGKNVQLQDYYSYNHDIPGTDEKLGGVNNLVYISGGVNANGTIDVTFTRKLNTGDSFDQVIIPDVKTQIC